MHVVIFEGLSWRTFAPVALSRPVFTLMTGAGTLLDKQIRHLHPTRLTLWVRPELEEHCQSRILPFLNVPTAVNQPLDDEPALLVSGRTLHFGRYEPPGQPAVVVDEGNLVRSAYATSPGLGPSDVMQRSQQWLKLLELPRMVEQSRLAESIWDLIGWNEESLIEDSLRFRDCPRPSIPAGVHLVHEEEVCIGSDVRLAPGCVLDASHGPVILADHVSVGANSVISGPCYIGPYSSVRPLTLIRPGTSIGMLCKVGGEISNSIIMDNTNKAHDGYLGDSYLGKWVNLGAGTTTSNLKNTYGEVTLKMGNREIPTGRRFLGSIIGDHTKTAILTRLMTGTYIGFCCQLAASGLVPRFVPSFTYLTDKGQERYRLDKAIEVTRRVYARRDRQWKDFDERLMRYVSETAPLVEEG